MTAADLADLIGQRVRIWTAQADHVFVEGEVVSVCFAPSLAVRDKDGVLHWHTSQLPIDIQKWERL